jgi:hypothetical protein
MAVVESVIDVYDHETVIEAAAKAVITPRLAALVNVAALKLKVAPTAYVSAELTMERKLPRVEILFAVGDELRQQEAIESADAEGDPVEGKELLPNCWRGTLTLQPIVHSDGYEVLRYMRAHLRDVTARWRTQLDKQLAFYNVMDVVSQGATPIFQTDKGLLACTLRQTILFGLIPGCLSELNQAQQA